MNKLKQFIKRYFIREKIIAVNIPVIQPSDLFHGKKAIVTGGTSGIGKAIAEMLTKNGSVVIITGRNEEILKKVAKDLLCEYFVLDITNINDVESFASKYGDVDMLVNSAGYHGFDNFPNVNLDTWDKVMNTNVRGMYFMSQYISKKMIEKGIKGHILNISSASALKPGWTPYEISKRAVVSLTEGLADNLIKYGIIVNGIAPGPTATSMLGLGSPNANLLWSANPSGRVSTADEIANLAYFLLSDLGNGVVADTIYITGGSGTLSNL